MAVTRRFQKARQRVCRNRALDTVALVAGSCWLLTAGRWSAGSGWQLWLVLMSAGESED